jgi:hypothetical protein
MHGILLKEMAAWMILRRGERKQEAVRAAARKKEEEKIELQLQKELLDKRLAELADDE